MSGSLRILTLNCWGVPLPVASKDRHERMVAIGEEIAKLSYDVVMLQEVWHKGDFAILKSKIGQTLPYSHYFYSGMIGSGLCIFTKHRIMETLYHKFDLNGYAHKVQHGDWFGGKGVGLAKLKVDGFDVHLYITHIHAEYNRNQDEYLAHRVSQSLDMSQFIKFTSCQADVAVLCGDLNLEPVDLGYRIITANGMLKDAWLEKVATKSSDPEGNTCDCPSNTYCGGKDHANYPNGKRIDYILYKGSAECAVAVKECSVTMGKVPGKPFNFSDHEGVEAELTLQRQPLKESKLSTEALRPLFQEALPVIDKGLEKTKSDYRFFILFGIACLGLVYLISVIHIPYPLDFFISFAKLVLILATGYGFIQNMVMIRSEVHGLEASREDLKHLLQEMS